MSSPLGSYLPGASPLHRLRPGAKLVGLFVFAALAIGLRSWITALVALALGLALALIAGLRGRRLWGAVRGFLLVAALLLVFTVVSTAFGRDHAGRWPAPGDWAAGGQQGLAVVGTLFGLLLAASAVTASTRMEDLLETIEWALAPLRRFGVHPERVALAFSLVITAIPRIVGIARETQQAARARGLRTPRALVVPLVLRTVAHAQASGEALAARGIGDEEQASAALGWTHE